MKMKQLLSIGALALTLVTCTSMSVFAAEAVGSRNEAAKNVAIKAWAGKENVINDVNITINTPVNKYATQELINKVKACVETSIEDKALATKVNEKIQVMYKDGEGAKKIFEALQDINQTEGDITTDATFDAAKATLQSMLNEFVDANGKSNADLDKLIKTYFNVPPSYGRLEYGKNSNNRRVVTLIKSSKIVFQVSSENVYNLKDELENRINSWSDLKDYFGKIQ